MSYHKNFIYIFKNFFNIKTKRLYLNFDKSNRKNNLKFIFLNNIIMTMNKINQKKLKKYKNVLKRNLMLLNKKIEKKNTTTKIWSSDKDRSGDV